MEQIRKIAEKTLLEAATTFRADKNKIYEECMKAESSANCRWIMEQIMENAATAADRQSPLCDDTGIPHILLELGPGRSLSGEMIEAVRAGVADGLRKLPGRPMAVMGDDSQRLDQSGGLSGDPAAMIPAPIQLLSTEEDVIRLYILMQGGGPEIRSKTYRVFHKHDVSVIIDNIAAWAAEEVGKLGCTPCTMAVGIGRSHYEASSLMLQAMAKGRYDSQSPMEQAITDRVNALGVGALGLGGDITTLATFLKVGPQRASGVRIVCMRPCCCFEPRVACSTLSR